MSKRFYFRASDEFVMELDLYKSRILGNKNSRYRVRALGEALDSFEDYQLDELYSIVSQFEHNQERIKQLINQGEEQKQQILHLSQIGNDVASHPK